MFNGTIVCVVFQLFIIFYICLRGYIPKCNAIISRLNFPVVRTTVTDSKKGLRQTAFLRAISQNPLISNLFYSFCFAAPVSSKLLTAFQSNMQVKMNTLITKYPVHRYGIYKTLRGCVFLHLYIGHPGHSAATIPIFR